jgi:hypothetical protein
VQLGPLPASLNLPVGLVYVGATLYVNDANENSLLSISGIFNVTAKRRELMRLLIVCIPPPP